VTFRLVIPALAKKRYPEKDCQGRISTAAEHHRRSVGRGLACHVGMLIKTWNMVAWFVEQYLHQSMG